MKIARHLISLPLVLVAAIVLAACGEDDPFAPVDSLSALVGDWEAVAIVFTSVADPSKSVDAVEEGASLTLNIQPSGNYTMSLEVGGFGLADVGVMEAENGKLIFHSTTLSRTDTADYQLDGDELSFTGSSIWDFNEDGIPENAELDVDFVRESGS